MRMTILMPSETQQGHIEKVVLVLAKLGYTTVCNNGMCREPDMTTRHITLITAYRRTEGSCSDRVAPREELYVALKEHRTLSKLLAKIRIDIEPMAELLDLK